ncbi:outer membrane protein OmpW [Marinobacter sp. R17]|uniref:OmpW/AlkL family protein n=1 Tax=Marinobacter TaxID=2742 RepID=UPI000F4CE35E|nr:MULTISPECIES: OmpW family outer membrane protein [Marinobacter]ROU00929.1 outer membrane protein OmpW [Marinobacter sp. R17]
MRKTVRYGLIAAALLPASLAQAHEAGDLILRAGAAMVDPHDSSGDVRVGSTKLDNWKVSVDSDTQLGLTASYMLSQHWGIGVLAATPFKHDINGAGALGGAGKLAETKHLPPTVTLQYFPLDPGMTIQPYGGIGVNYTHFFDEKTTDTLTNALGAASTDIKLDDSVGLAAELGADVMLTDRLLLNAAVWYADIDTTATIKAYDGAGNKVATGKVDVDIDPFVYMIGVGYRF